MHPLSDKDLDRLSREAAEQYDVEQNTSGWDRLEQKLNKHLPEKDKKDRRRFLFFIWIVALLSGSGLLWILTSDQPLQTIALKEGSSEITRNPAERRGIDQVPAEKPLNEPGRDLQEKEITTPGPSIQKNPEPVTEIEHPNLPGNKVAQTTPSTIINSPTKQLRSSGPDRTIIANKKNDLRKAGNDPISDRLVSETPPSVQGSGKKNNFVEKADGTQSTNNEDKVSEKTTPDTQNSSPANAKQQGPSVENKPTPAAPETLTAAADSGKTVRKVSIPRRKSGFDQGLLIGAVGAPDMSNVKFTNTDKVGYNFGIHLNYRMSQRWSVTTGAIYTRKNYTSRGKDFNPPKGSWIDNVNLNSVEGNCDMFDIPLNVRYDLNKGSNHRYFLSTGLSTYLMKKEEYHYRYQYTNGNPGYRHRSYASDEHHWLSILNISAGFEKKLSKRFSIQGEPYLKIPLAGVGYGNLKLNSYGVYFSLRYNTGLLSGKK